MSFQFRHAICNEAFQGWSFADTCKTVKKAGYTGFEIAPFTLAEDPATIPAAQRKEYRDIIQSEGLTFAGLHWLMVSPKGLHVTTPDAALREKSWRHIHSLIELCADLGPNGVLVFGSPQQRSTTGGLSPAQATRNFVDGLAQVAPHAAERGVKVLLEALPKGQCDVVGTLDEAAALVRQIGHPSILTMFDTHNAVDEIEPHAVLVERHFGLIRHVHVNEMDGKHCGQGNYDFKPVLRTLKRLNYQGWVSLEAFDFSFGGEAIATQSLRYLEAEIARLDA
ncbi:MAG: sugar phosphate isomerase/epimerase [Acidobacteria bacterium]|nr:sugar phosphate isomerase/epimerase [Acidobacteriota bacterium]